MSKDFQPGQVVFFRVTENGYDFKQIPAKIISRCSYATYKLRSYGGKADEYASQHQIELYSQETATKVRDQMGKNKKMIKFLKNAEKDFLRGGGEQPEEKRRIFNLQCKQEEGEGDLDDKKDNVAQQSQDGKVNYEKYQAIQNLKISSLLSDCRSTGVTKYSYRQGQAEINCQQKSRLLLLMRLEWGFDDLIFHFNAETQKQIHLEGVQNLISQIMESELIDPVDYVTSPLLKKMKETMQSIKKTKRPKLKNYLTQRYFMIQKGFQNYLKNYTVFARVCKKYRKQMQEQKETQPQK